MVDLKEELERVREELLDLSLRNPLLNFRAYSRSSVEVRDEVPRQVYRRLVLEGRKMAFVPREEGQAGGDKRDDDAEAGAGVLWELPPPGAELEDKHTDRFLQTEHTERDLQKRLFHIDNKARTLVEDAGYNALHLAIGFLEWYEDPDQEKARTAPLILVPVQIERTQATSAFKIRWTGQDLDTNLSLKLKLGDRGLELPEFEMPEDSEGVYAYLEQVREQVASVPGWEVVPEIALGFFRFTNLSMYKDLDPAEWPTGQAPHQDDLVRRILDPTETDDAAPPDISVEQLDPREVDHVLDADPSQAAVIEAVKDGHDLVVEGPPGTGKSQTIVNLIAELMAQGKRVLFVSEKKAALEVVHGKLDAVGLGDFCLELHSHKTNKGEILAELQRVAFQEPASASPSEDVYRELETVTAQLDGYAAALREPVGKTGLSPFELICRRQSALEHFEDGDLSLPIVELPDAHELDEEDWQTALGHLEDLEQALGPVWPIEENPWRGTAPGPILPRKRRRIEQALDRAAQACQAVDQAVDQLARLAHRKTPPATPKATIALVRAIERLGDVDAIDPALVLSDRWANQSGTADVLVSQLEELGELKAHLSDRFTPRAFEVELEPVRSAYRETSSSPLRWLLPRYWRARARVRDLYAADPPSARGRLLEDLAALSRYRDLEASIEAADADGRALFGDRWQGAKSDPDELRALARWIREIREAISQGVLTEASLELVAPGAKDEPIGERTDAAKDALSGYRTALTELIDLLGTSAEQVWDRSLAAAGFEGVEARVDAWRSSTGRLDAWSTYVDQRDDVADSAAAPVLEALLDGRIDPGDLEACFTGNLADGLLEHAFQTREALTGFSGDLHASRVERFRELDRAAIEENRARVRRKVWSKRPHLVEGASSSSEAGVLVREFRKKQRHLSLRKLMIQAGSLVQDLKPCFMMSPLSVAKYLDPEKIRFDVVIFDEASQVRPQDALGAILRGDQLVVMGDPKQLPPTSFFEAVVERDEDETKVGSIVDLQSILDACEGTLPRKMLRWHYRSRHESLIAVSNSEFYDDNLVIYPSPYQGESTLGLQLELLEDTVYDRGGSRQNRGEAQAIAQAALEHFREHPDQSLGIGTFSAAQEEAIREEVEILRRQHPEMDPYFSEQEGSSPFDHEHFMIKNLETIQGDERDVIFVSVGYGFDDQGRLTHNFGPLNHEGGWRRLNVLITRARNRCRVFSNFTSDALETTPQTPRGVKGLTRFLAYAEDREAPGIEPSRQAPETSLEAAIEQSLEDEGYTVHAKVGSAGFRVDLAVVDPEEPERYLLGIELDGPGYHDARVARERDRLRRDVLEERGWRFHHVWAADWYKSPETAKRRLLDAVDQAREATPEGAPVTTRAWEPLAATDAGGGQAASTSTDEAAPIEEALVHLDELAGTYQALEDPPLPAYDEAAVDQQAPELVAGLAEAVEALTEVEGPIHRDLVVMRIRDAWELDRAGQRLKAAVDAAIERAQALGQITVEEGFLWAGEPGEVEVRQRTDGTALDISLIPDAEVQAAVDLVLEKQRATPVEELASQVASLLGFQRKGHRIEGRVERAVATGLSAGRLEQVDDGRVRLVGTDD